MWEIVPEVDKAGCERASTSESVPWKNRNNCHRHTYNTAVVLCFITLNLNGVQKKKLKIYLKIQGVNKMPYTFEFIFILLFKSSSHW